MRYLVRVELNNGSMDDFNLLHQLMDKKGFSKTVVSGKNREYHLPRATYLIKTSLDIGQVLKVVENVVSVTGKTAEILVVEYSGCTWSGLTPVK